ncbi:PstS family phosphate ABC transporter substrate-binding protein [Daejeonia sp. YH14]|uniref:PstS family phosphate ABC transporter substrate-binding protein n=1 Tax=Daejeonia sp. YH14 TaxID=3439042 RepID=UPI003F495623
MNKIILTFSFVCLLLLSGCSPKDKSTDTVYNKGKITIYTDDSFVNVVSSLADAYMMSYPETKINVKVKKEDLAFLDLLDNKAALIAISKPLTQKEIAQYVQKTDLKYTPAYFAADAVVFIVPKTSAKKSISIDEIKTDMRSPKEKNIIFDGNNSSNLNFVSSKLGYKPSDLNYSIINGNESLIEQLNKYPDKIGVVGLNSLSRPYSKEAEKLRSMVKILPVTEDGKSYEPSVFNLRNLKYPFSRPIYFLYNEGGFGIAQGIIRFSCTQLGQLVVEKEGLQPYYLYKREVQMR